MLWILQRNYDSSNDTGFIIEKTYNYITIINWLNKLALVNIVTAYYKLAKMHGPRFGFDTNTILKAID